MSMRKKRSLINIYTYTRFTCRRTLGEAYIFVLENDHYIFPSLFYPVLIIEIITFSMQELFCEREIRVQQTKEEERNFETNRNYFSIVFEKKFSLETG